MMEKDCMKHGKNRDGEVPQIIPLKGPDRIRKRPSVIFGSNELEGAKQAVSDILHIFATEAQLGYCKYLTVVQNGASLTIRAADRGLALGQDGEDDAAWKKIFGDFYCEPACPPSEEGYSFKLQDPSHHVLYGASATDCATFLPEDGGCFELYCAVSVCRFMDVVSVRNGMRGDLHFEGGHNLGGLTREKTDEENFSVFHFELDPDVFTETVIPQEFFLEKLERFAMLCPGLTCAYVNTADGRLTGFCYPEGIAEYVQGDPVYYKKIQGKGKERYNRGEYEACVEVALAPSIDSGRVLCLHNFREMTYGGTHYKRMEERICDAVNDILLQDVDAEPLTFEELSKHLSVVLVSWCTPHCTVWSNGTRLAIENRVITEMTEDALSTELRNFVYRNKEMLRPVVEAVLQTRTEKDE